MNNIVAQVVIVLTAIVGLAALAVLVSNRAQTAGVLNAFFSGFASLLGAAVSPVTGASVGSGIGSGFSTNFSPTLSTLR